LQTNANADGSDNLRLLIVINTFEMN
jgi:hypothetical protein